MIGRLKVITFQIFQYRSFLEVLKSKVLAPVVRKVDNSIHWIKCYPMDSVVCFANTYPLHGDLSGAAFE